MPTATIAEVRANLPELLHQPTGDQELLIIGDGKPLGRLLLGLTGVLIGGRGKGKLTLHADDDEHLKDFEKCQN